MGGLEGLIIAIVVVILLLALVSYAPIDPDVKRWVYFAVIVLLILWLLRGGLPL